MFDEQLSHQLNFRRDSINLIRDRKSDKLKITVDDSDPSGKVNCVPLNLEIRLFNNC
jgi:hypothetical protein